MRVTSLISTSVMTLWLTACGGGSGGSGADPIPNSSAVSTISSSVPSSLAVASSITESSSAIASSVMEASSLSSSSLSVESSSSLSVASSSDSSSLSNSSSSVLVVASSSSFSFFSSSSSSSLASSIQSSFVHSSSSSSVSSSSSSSSSSSFSSISSSSSFSVSSSISSSSSVSSNSASSATTVPSTPTVTVTYGVKQVILNWSGATGASYYKVSKQPTVGAGYTMLESNITTTRFADSLSVHLTDWVNMTYKVDACNTLGCTSSSEVSALDSTQAIGYFKASNTKNFSLLGGSVALSSDGLTLVVGDPGESSSAVGVNGNQSDSNAATSGAVYVFVRNGNTWVQEAYIKASNTNINDQFGWALALSGDGNTLAVGALGEASSADGINGNQANNDLAESGAVYVFTRGLGGWSQQAYIKASNPDVGDYFGRSLSLSFDGNSLAVGAIGEDSNATGINGDQTNNFTSNSGAVYLFTRTVNSWSQQAFVKASNTGNGDAFGASIALSSDGNTLAVGAYNEDSSASNINGDQTNNSATNSGAVYVFSRSGSSWSQQAYIKPSNPQMNAYFSRVSLSDDGNTLAVGANQESSIASKSGAVYVFTRSATTWTERAMIKAINAGADDYFGMAVKLSGDGNSLAVGASGEDSSAKGINGDPANDLANYSGAVYVFTRNGNAWTQKSYVKASNTNTNNYFGENVALSANGETLAVGAVGERSSATGINGDQTSNVFVMAGAVYIY